MVSPFVGEHTNYSGLQRISHSVDWWWEKKVWHMGALLGIHILPQDPHFTWKCNTLWKMYSWVPWIAWQVARDSHNFSTKIIPSRDSLYFPNSLSLPLSNQRLFLVPRVCVNTQTPIWDVHKCTNFRKVILHWCAPIIHSGRQGDPGDIAGECVCAIAHLLVCDSKSEMIYSKKHTMGEIFPHFSQW